LRDFEDAKTHPFLFAASYNFFIHLFSLFVS